MMVLVGCESSGKVREAFRKRGHIAFSCDYQPADDGSPWHLQCDVRIALRMMRWDLFIVHPTCTFLSSSGLHWNGRIPGRAEKTEQALDFVREMLDAPVPRIALENPRGCIGTRIRKADQTIQPYEFGDDASKQTDLWLVNLPPLKIIPEKRVPGRIVGVDKRGKPIERWANQTDSGQNRLGPSEDRWKLRSATYDGIAEAFAENWG